MSQSLIELIFNISYLLIIWFMVFKMFQRKTSIKIEELLVSDKFLHAFLLLALGDTGHVGFRVVAYFNGGLEKNSTLVGYGSFATAITLTFFYMLILETWRLRYKKTYSLTTCILLATGIVRLIIIALPQNNWSSITPPYTWSLIRNIPLMIQGIGAATLILKDSLKHNDSIFIWIGIMIFISYSCYIPVILFSHINPEVGMLMIPKTLAYLAAGFIGYKGLFKNSISSFYVKKTI